jgi:hypothetical protein
LPGDLTIGNQFTNNFPGIQFQTNITFTSVTFYSPHTVSSSDVSVLFVVYIGDFDIFQTNVTIPGNTTEGQTITVSFTSRTFPAGTYFFGWNALGSTLNYYRVNANWCGIVYG